jgi:hypothetical protein
MEAQAIVRIPHWQDDFTRSAPCASRIGKTTSPDQRPIYPHIQSIFVLQLPFAE